MLRVERSQSAPAALPCIPGSNFEPMFKRAKEEIFQKPRIKTSREVRTHQRERTPVERMFYMLGHHLRRKAALRMVLSLPQHEIDKNIYMISEMMLRAVVEEGVVDRMFFAALGRLVQSRKACAIKDLCMDYLEAQLNLDKQYLGLAVFLVRHFKDAVVSRRDGILGIVEDPCLREVVSRLEVHRPVVTLSACDPIYFIR